MPLTAAQTTLLDAMIDGASKALTLQHAMMDYEHDHVETEYLITTKVAEELVEANTGRIRVEHPTKKLRSVLLRDKRYGKGSGKIPVPKIRSGRIDVVVFNDTSAIIPNSMCEAKIKVRSFKSIEKDAVRFVNILRLLDAGKTPELFGVCLFPLVEAGTDLSKMRDKLQKRIQKIKAGISTFNTLHPLVETDFYDVKITEFPPTKELIDEGDPASGYITMRYLTHLAAVTVVRR
ncbi:MAG: hypothetical protein ABF968_08310 [Acetobacter sp.]|uniref:hypothetical protein n=1 Tax=Acetobacter sp. TaxID=440 RepID=UPI0039ECFB34